MLNDVLWRASWLRYWVKLHSSRVKSFQKCLYMCIFQYCCRSETQILDCRTSGRWMFPTEHLKSPTRCQDAVCAHLYLRIIYFLHLTSASRRNHRSLLVLFYLCLNQIPRVSASFFSSHLYHISFKGSPAHTKIFVLLLSEHHITHNSQRP